eukprot:m.53417 g.53417  ORF g.53417 m.53417 type:complete len:87 (+) comp11361_c0_seq8:848-1108(+)
MRLATFTVSPKRQYLGLVTPTTPAKIFPLCMPTCNATAEPSTGEDTSQLCLIMSTAKLHNREAWSEHASGMPLATMSIANTNSGPC